MKHHHFLGFIAKITAKDVTDLELPDTEKSYSIIDNGSEISSSNMEKRSGSNGVSKIKLACSGEGGSSNLTFKKRREPQIHQFLL